MRRKLAGQMSSDAVNLLFELLEQPRPRLSGAASELTIGVDGLLKAGLLESTGHEAVSASLADHEDTPVSLIASSESDGLAYFSPHIGHVPIPSERLAQYTVRFPALLSALGKHLGFAAIERPRELVSDQLWELGAARLPGSKARISVWFVRRIWTGRGLQALGEALRVRPYSGLRVVLTSSRPARVPEVVFPNVVVVALLDVMTSSPELAVDPDILGARLGAPTPTRADGSPLQLSPDSTKLVINCSLNIEFRSSMQKDAIRQLVDAHRKGTALTAASLTDLGSLRRLFGAKKWRSLEPYLKSVDGRWRFDV